MFIVFSNVILGYIMSKGNTRSYENCNHSQHVGIENPQGHSSFQRHGSILLLFHLELHFHHGLDYEIVTKNQSFLMDS
jgi:hypothetical protein